ncbi:hypothetical protein GvMRE_IIg227 [endosymbiont GvMRE of Glomus versiforme]|nr:hypothetical protein GvMRE_IIg227 [endosymbiont GvMRE of Glomus versiforme]
MLTNIGKFFLIWLIYCYPIWLYKSKTQEKTVRFVKLLINYIITNYSQSTVEEKFDLKNLLTTCD